MNRSLRPTPCKPVSRTPCRNEYGGELASYADVVDAYINNHRREAKSLLCFYRSFQSLEQAIEYAALCKLPSGNRHPHQRRIPKPALPEAERRLHTCAAELRKCKSFAELHALVRERIGGVPGIGALTVYDIAHHLGAFLKLEPDAVYLHAGTAAGAKALGHLHTAETLALADLPPEFSRLRPYEIEDCLCIYKHELKALRC
jgi:hypothetical protein